MSENNLIERRDFIAAGATVLGAVALSGGVHAQGSERPLKVGVVGCGGRGTGAAGNILEADPKIEITGLADVFQNQAQQAARALQKRDPQRVKVTPDSIFHGLDAYKRLLATDIDLVILATPPGFRPMHIEAALKAGKHVFTEKPVAVDVTGVRKCLDLVNVAREKKLAVVAGTQRRHQAGYIETMKQVHDGVIGDVVSGRAYWNGNGIWFRSRAKGMSDVQYQLHNWYHFVWTCGDHIVEQHVHNLDVINWALKAHPIKATGMGGRSNRQVGDPNVVGHIFDHFAVEFEYPNGVIVQSYCRQIEGCANSVSEALVGTKGRCSPNGYSINGKQVFVGRETNPYVQEHIDLIKSIRDGKPLNELEAVTTSTMTAILGRMTTYTGKTLSWDKVMETSKEDTFPKELNINGELPVSPVPVVGKTAVV